MPALASSIVEQLEFRRSTKLHQNLNEISVPEAFKSSMTATNENALAGKT